MGHKGDQIEQRVEEAVVSSGNKGMIKLNDRYQARGFSDMVLYNPFYSSV